MVCVFCGSQAKITMEHIVPRWIGSLFSEKPGGTVKSEQRDGSVRTYNIELFGQKVGGPCARCNNGWMEKLESRAREFLGPMIQPGGTGSLRATASAILPAAAAEVAMSR